MMKTTADQVQFRWRTPLLGHEWKRSGRSERLIPKSGGNRLLDPKTPHGVCVYTPSSGLFRKFAMLDIADDKVGRAEILAFAKDYGDVIAQPHEGNLVLDRIVKRDRKHATREVWCRAIQHMRRAVDLWDRINDPERHEELRDVILRSKGAITYRALHHRLERKVDDESFEVIATGKGIAAYPARDITRPANRALQLEVRKALTDTVTPSHSTPNLTRDLLLLIDPANLLAYMWLTFARVVSGEIEERLCVICKEERFYIGSGPGLHRDDKTTCGAACRKRKERQDDKPHLGRSGKMRKPSPLHLRLDGRGHPKVG